MDYTKGNWEVVTNGNSLMAVSVRGKNICSFEPEFDTPKFPMQKSPYYRQLGGEDEANAHLIAAAPEMYEALKLLQSALTEYGLRDIKKRFSLCVADAAASNAIAKAEVKA